MITRLIALTSLAIGCPLPSEAQEVDPFADPPRPGPAPTPQTRDPFIAKPTESEPPSRAEDQKINVAYFTEWIEIDSIGLTELLADESLDLSDGDQVRAAIEESLRAGKAELLESCLLLNRSGGKAKLEAIAELIYPVEWDPGDGEALKGMPSKPSIVNGVVRWPPARFPHPSTFEMRPVGTCLEVAASALADDQTVRGQSVPEITTYEGDSTHGEVDLGNGQTEALTRLPIFSTIRPRTASFSTQIGKTVWLGTSRGRKGHSVLTFQRTSALHHNGAAAPTKRKPVFTIIAELIEVDASWFAAQMQMLGSGSLDSRSLRQKIQAGLGSEAFTLVDLTTLSGPVGEQVRSDSIVERIYPTEYDPPTLPTYREPDEKGTLYWGPSALPTPTAFETRNTGTTFSMDTSTHANNASLHINLMGELVHYQERTISETPTPNGPKPLIVMPIFHTLRLTTDLSLAPGETVLAGALTPRTQATQAQSDRRLLMFLRLAK